MSNHADVHHGTESADSRNSGATEICDGLAYEDQLLTPQKEKGKPFDYEASHEARKSTQDAYKP